MTSLKDSWQEQRKQRQQEVAQRQQQVSEILDRLQTERHMRASELREDLRLFQLELQLDTQDFLAHANTQRQVKAVQVAERLRAFTQTLREQTAQLISVQAADRAVMAQQLFEELSEFHANLNTSVASLRQDLQRRMQQLREEVHILQAETQHLLQANQQERIRNQIQLMQELATWVESLQLTVQTYLAELVLVRHDCAQQLHKMLQQDRDRRASEVNTLFQDLGQFRAELKAYCAELHNAVWGSEPEVQNREPVNAAPSQEAAKSKPQPAKPKAQTLSPQAPSLQSPPASKPEPAPVVVTPVAAPAVAQPPAPSLLLSTTSQIEKDVYQLIDQTQGARLTEIESALGINRFQAVDALRSLIKKGLVTQRDRTYLIQEDVSQ